MSRGAIWAGLGLCLVGAFFVLPWRAGVAADAGRKDDSAPAALPPPPAARGRRVGLNGAASAPAGDDALAASPDPLVLANNRGAELLLEGDLSAALAKFEACYGERPTSDVFRSNLGETLLRLALDRYAQAQFDPALGFLARAEELLPERAVLPRLHARWQQEAELELNHWSQGSDLIELSFDVTRPDLLAASDVVLQHLERSYGDLALWFGMDPIRDLGSPRFRVVLYDDAQFEALTGLGDWAAGVFDGVIRIAVGSDLSDKAHWRQTTSHELVHAFNYALAGSRVPGWLNEGLAQLLETEHPDLERARRQLGARRFPLAELRDSLATWTDSAEIARAYAQSLLLVAQIRHEQGAEVLRQMLLECKAGKAPADTYQDICGVPLTGHSLANTPPRIPRNE